MSPSQLSPGSLPPGAEGREAARASVSLCFPLGPPVSDSLSTRSLAGSPEDRIAEPGGPDPGPSLRSGSARPAWQHVRPRGGLGPLGVSCPRPPQGTPCHTTLPRTSLRWDSRPGMWSRAGVPSPSPSPLPPTLEGPLAPILPGGRGAVPQPGPWRGQRSGELMAWNTRLWMSKHEGVQGAKKTARGAGLSGASWGHVHGAAPLPAGLCASVTRHPLGKCLPRGSASLAGSSGSAPTTH